MPAGTEGDLLEVGRIDRAHGLRGDVVVVLVTNRLERLDPGTHLVAVSPGGKRRDLMVSASRPHGRRHIVVFEGLDSRDDAEALHGWVLLAERMPTGSDPTGSELYVHELIGLLVVDSAGVEHGSITSVEANPASDLLVVDDKWYVPARFVVGRDEGKVVVDVPDGIFE